MTYMGHIGYFKYYRSLKTCILFIITKYYKIMLILYILISTHIPHSKVLKIPESSSYTHTVGCTTQNKGALHVEGVNK